MVEQKQENPLIWDLQDLMSRYGVTRSAISDWAIKNPEMKEYKGQPLPKGRYNILASDFAYIEFLKNKLENVGSRARKIEFEIEKLKEQTYMLKLERLEKQKKLVLGDDVSLSVIEIVTNIRNRFLALPSLMAMRLSGISDPKQVAQILTDEIDRSLTELSEKMRHFYDTEDTEMIEFARSRYGDDCSFLFDSQETT
jgi:hypothetical protein